VQVTLDELHWQAVDTALRKVADLTSPLRKQRDVEELQLGAKTAAKVLEIVETGALKVNKAIKQDPQAQTILKVKFHTLS